MDIRKTKGAKIAAVGFIGLTLLGNYWMILAIMGTPVPGLIFDLFFIGVLIVGLGAVSLFAERFLHQPEEEPESNPNDE